MRALLCCYVMIRAGFVSGVGGNGVRPPGQMVDPPQTESCKNRLGVVITPPGLSPEFSQPSGLFCNYSAQSNVQVIEVKFLVINRPLSLLT